MKTVCHFPIRYIKLAVMCCICLLPACQQTVVSIDINNQAYLDTITAGSTLVLQQDLIIPPDKTRVYFQFGTQVIPAKIDKYQAWCEFEIKTLAETQQTIHMDQFLLQKLVNERSGLLDSAGPGISASPLEEFSTVLYLQSARQPDVLRFTCLRRKGNRMQTYLRLNEIQAASADFILLNLK